ncbi:hypothetical protein ABIQ69_15690 [Agromyces sp. G08B096]|uniref:Uncharacterized protein n=1 Tax=Agromyces sp. G08B096 TaxID=3156399 RepID=A0AAU7W7T6_9MICO
MSARVAAITALAALAVVGLALLQWGAQLMNGPGPQMSWQGDEPPAEVIDFFAWQSFGYTFVLPGSATLTAASLLALLVVGAHALARRSAQRAADRDADAAADAELLRDAHDQRTGVDAEIGRDD